MLKNILYDCHQFTSYLQYSRFVNLLLWPITNYLNWR